MLLVALAYGVLAQGGFYWPQHRFFGALLLGSLVPALPAVWRGRHRLSAPVLGCAALAGWTAVSAIRADNLAGAAPTVLTIVGAAAVVVVVQHLAAGQRETLAVGLVGAGLIAAIVGWVGVVTRAWPYALVDGGMWRAASGITYANATAALLAPLC